MTKPWEETYAFHDAARCVVSVNTGPSGDAVVAVIRAPYPVLGREVGGLFSAAPDMARALLAVLEWDKTSRELPEDPAKNPMEAVRAALTRAGVPLP